MCRADCSDSWTAGGFAERARLCVAQNCHLSPSHLPPFDFLIAAAPLLDKQLHTAYHLTYRTFGGGVDVDVNTEPFRNAIWYYTQRLYGVRNDHYDYSRVNKLLPIPIKTFVKKVACYPELVTLLDFCTFTQTFDVAEKVHIVLLVCEARRQAALLFALRAVMRYMVESL